ncbi:tyrosine-type recombinase/integrase [Lactobacillus sp. LL6]|nr:tyrosine-type recombinase/integrase [Lactobacillus sp. LL6]
MNRLNDQINSYLEFVKIEKGLSNNTILAYKQDLTEFINFLQVEGIKSWPSDVIDINAFLARQSQEKSDSSVTRMISTLNKFYQWLARQNIQKLNPMLEVDAPDRKVQHQTALTENEIVQLLEKIDTNKKNGIRDRALLEVFYATGIKTSELVNLRVQDVYKDLQLVQIHDGNKSRLIPINKKALNWIEKYEKEVRNPLVHKKESSSQNLFLNNRATKITRQAIWQIIKRACKNANIEKNVTPNMLRYTFTVHLLNHGADLQVVQAILGYTGNDIFQRELSQKRILDVYLNSHPRL